MPFWRQFPIDSLLPYTEQVLFRTTSSSIDCLNHVSSAVVHEKTEPMDFQEAVQSMSSAHCNPSRTINGNKYIRIATSPFEADVEKGPETQEAQTSGFADSFVRTPLVVPVNVTVMVSYFQRVLRL